MHTDDKVHMILAHDHDDLDNSPIHRARQA